MLIREIKEKLIVFHNILFVQILKKSKYITVKFIVININLNTLFFVLLFKINLVKEKTQL